MDPLAALMAQRPGELLDVADFTAQLRSREPWRAKAACRGAPVRTFFATSTHRAELLCGRCPVRAECYASAVEHEECGWWGGLSERARRALHGSSELTASGKGRVESRP